MGQVQKRESLPTSVDKVTAKKKMKATQVLTQAADNITFVYWFFSPRTHNTASMFNEAKMALYPFAPHDYYIEY